MTNQENGIDGLVTNGVAGGSTDPTLPTRSFPTQNTSDQEASQSATNLDQSHPLYLPSTDISGVPLISLHLTGTESYSLWSRSMRLALLGRNKMGLVDGTWKKEMFREEYWPQWERVNAIVLSWIINVVDSNLLSGVVYATEAWTVWEELKERFDKVSGSRTFGLHREIATLAQGTASVSIYFTKLKGLWNEFESLIPPHGCNLCE
ncbi:uncharacterized protein LOC132031722 [Lycium ferocissimum]|uniref:uncharacterized protein LOC132031722 n=1 Tax=Lycium ferocissimum TaxID=112874 RepID=UPI002814D006|nr:uncharacterized protein LOC132031722 [Lycium ferocissimum]